MTTTTTTTHRRDANPWPEFAYDEHQPSRVLAVVPTLTDPETETLHPVPTPRHRAPDPEVATVKELLASVRSEGSVLSDAVALLGEQLRTGHLWGLSELDHCEITIGVDGSASVLILADYDVVLEWGERYAKAAPDNVHLNEDTGSLELSCRAVVDGLRWELRTHDWQGLVAR